VSGSAAILWLASLLVFPLAGAPLLSHRAFARYGAPARFVLAGAVGAVAVSFAMTVVSLTAVKWNLPLLVVAGAAECFALRAAVGRTLPQARLPEAPRPPGSRIPFSPLEWAAVTICAASVVVSAIAALTASATSPDLILFWGSKAEAFAAARTIDDNFLGEPFLRFLHTSYPPLVTNAYAFATIAAGRFSWLGAIATFPALVAALAVSLPAVLRRWAPRRDALVATAFIAAAAAVAGDALDMAGNADMALLLYEILAAAVFLGASGPRAGDQASAVPSAELLGGLLLGGAAAAKVEGLPFVLTAAGLYLLLRRRAPRELPASFARILLPTVLSLGAWFAYGRRYFLFRWYESYGPTLEVHLSRLGIVLGQMLEAFWRTGYALPWLVPLAALFAVRRFTAQPGRFRAGTGAFPIAISAVLSLFFVFTYLHGSPDPSLWITWSAGRIFLVVAALLVLAVTRRQASAGAASESVADSASRAGPPPAKPD